MIFFHHHKTKEETTQEVERVGVKIMIQQQITPQPLVVEAKSRLLWEWERCWGPTPREELVYRMLLPAQDLGAKSFRLDFSSSPFNRWQVVTDTIIPDGTLLALFGLEVDIASPGRVHEMRIESGLSIIFHVHVYPLYFPMEHIQEGEMKHMRYIPTGFFSEPVILRANEHTRIHMKGEGSDVPIIYNGLALERRGRTCI